MAGTQDGFSASDFRTNIRFAMNMAFPNATAEQPTFKFEKTYTYPVGTKLDADGRPLDASVSASVSQPSDVTVPVAVEISDARPDETPVGTRRKVKAVLTILDEDYDQVKTAHRVLLGGDEYIISHVLPPIGLFDATIYQMVCYAVDEK